MRFIRKIIDLITNNFKIKIGICIFLILALIIVVVSGTIYSKNLNDKNLTFKVTKNKEVLKEINTNKETEEDWDKKDKLNEIKYKIKELDANIDLSITENNIDNDIAYYEKIYNELLKKKEEEKEDTYNESEESNSYIEEEYAEPDIPQNNPGTTTPIANSPVINPPVVVPPVTTTPKPAAPVGDNGEGINPPASDSEEHNPPADDTEGENQNPPAGNGQGGVDQGENSQPVISDSTKPNNP